MVGGGGGSSTKSTIIVSIDTGSTVAAYSDSSYQTLVKTASEKSTGEYWLTGLANGTYYIKATKSGDETTTSYTITEYGVYRIGMSYDTRPVFTYTGTYELVDDADADISAETTWQGDWKLRLLTSGTLTFSKIDSDIDVFLVGGGGGSGKSNTDRGAGGGYTHTERAVAVDDGTPYEVIVGAGGLQSSNGGASSAFGYSANGGTTSSGGSGGGTGGQSTLYGGGSDGSNSQDGTSGQGTTTREFGGYTNTVASNVSESSTLVLSSEPTDTEKAFLVSGQFITIGNNPTAYGQVFPITNYDESTRTVTVLTTFGKVTASAGTVVRFGNLYAAGGEGRSYNGSRQTGSHTGFYTGMTNTDYYWNAVIDDNSGSGAIGANSSESSVGGSGIVIIRNARS